MYAYLFFKTLSPLNKFGTGGMWVYEKKAEGKNEWWKKCPKEKKIYWIIIEFNLWTNFIGIFRLDKLLNLFNWSFPPPPSLPSELSTLRPRPRGSAPWTSFNFRAYWAVYLTKKNSVLFFSHFLLRSLFLSAFFSFIYFFHRRRFLLTFFSMGHFFIRPFFRGQFFLIPKNVYL